MDMLIYKLLLLGLVSYTSTSVVKWVPNFSFNLPINFKDGKLPCSKSNVIFPRTLSSSISVESILEVGSLILPEDGVIDLKNSVINLGAENTDTNCTAGNSYFLDKSISAWNQAGVWSSSRFTQATPDSERLPCYDDVVQFYLESRSTVKLPDEVQYVRELKIGNFSLVKTELEDYLEWSPQLNTLLFELNVYNEIGLEMVSPNCQMRFGCPCQPHELQIDCTVKFCPKPSCEAPIKPTGYCCSFCGGHIMFNADESFDMITFKELADKVIDGYGDSLVYHIGVVSISPEYKIQLVIVEKGEYDGLSFQAIDEISNAMSDHWFKGEKLSQISGIPLSKKGWGWKIFVSMFFVVVVVMSAIYLYYYKLSSVRIPSLGGRPRDVFSSFQFRSGSVVSLMRRGSSISGEIPSRTAFRNPLYDSKRDSVEVEQSVDED